MVLPSGEKCGFDVRPWKLVRRRALPPARSTIQMLFAYANAICVLLTVGVRSMRVCAPARAGAATKAAMETSERCRDIGRKGQRGRLEHTLEKARRRQFG